MPIRESCPSAVPARLISTTRRLRARSAALLLMAAAGGIGLTGPAPVFAQDGAGGDAAAATEGGASNQQLLVDFIHYTLIENLDLSRSWGQAILDRTIDPAEFVKLVESAGIKRFDDAVLRAQRRPETEEVATQLRTLYIEGKRATARSAKAIDQNVKGLLGNMRERSTSRTLLIEAGEYAVPSLLPALIQTTNPTLQAESRQVLVAMGRQAIIPLVTALPQLDPVAQETVVRVLGDIPYGTSVPFLYALRENAGVRTLKDACDEAIQKIVGGINNDVPVAQRFVALAEDYYAETPSLTSFPGEEQQLLWSYDPGVGLLPTGVLSEVYHEAMAMKLCERALTLDAGLERALSLWLAANFSREIDSPEGYENPAYPSDRREAMYYAVAAGSMASQRVLGRALSATDTPLARKAIAAIEKTAGGANLWTGRGADATGAGGGGVPLLEALRYSNRRVQYEAALALGSAQPRTAFDGSDRVVPTLASAIRDASARYAVVLTDDPEKRPALADALRSSGYQVLPPAGSLEEINQAVAEAPGIDVVVMDFANQPPERTTDLISSIRGRAKLRSTPVAAVLTFDRYNELSGRYATDELVRLVRAGVEAAGVAQAANELADKATGGSIGEEEAAAYKTRSLKVLRDLAVSGSGTVLNIADAATPLTAALRQEEGDVKMQIAEVLSYIPLPAVQGALFDAAMQAGGEERVMLLQKTADSAKRFGNLLDARHVRSLVDLARTGKDEEATAAAALMGALNLPSTDLIPLIIEGSAQR